MNIAQYIYDTCLQYGVNDNIARLAVAQASFETFRFTSAIFKENNNAFGYKYVGQKLATGENRGHATYKNLHDSVLEWVLYWNRRRSEKPFPLVIYTTDVFAEYLKSVNYYEAPLSVYSNGLALHYREIWGEEPKNFI